MNPILYILGEGGWEGRERVSVCESKSLYIQVNAPQSALHVGMDLESSGLGKNVMSHKNHCILGWLNPVLWKSEESIQ
jgi:hypothetical protein